MYIGVDIADVSRFENVKDSFLDKCFTEKEKSLFNVKNAAERMAVNFSAKEAFSKALGTGVRGFSLTDISVLRDEMGKPYFEFSKKVKDILDAKSIISAELSMSHDGGNAVSVVVLQRENINQYHKFLAKTDTDKKDIITLNDVRSSIYCRSRDTHKGDYGKIFIVAGSKGLTGAGIMASKAAIRSGGGLVTLGCPESLNHIFEISLHEVMTKPLEDNGISLVSDCAEEIIKKANASSVLAFGCGLTDTDDVYKILEKIIPNVKVPMVIDADGINALSKNINILKKAKAPIIITPHIMEFSRLSGLSVDQIEADMKKCASEFAVKWDVTLVLKSHNTVVAHSDGTVKTNILGNPGMATGGSGDVLTGVIASFVAQKIPHPAESGVYIHSLAGDISAEDKGQYGMIPTDIIENIPYAINMVCRKD